MSEITDPRLENDGVLCAWSASRGWIDSLSELHEAQLEGEAILHVDDDQIARGIEACAPLAVALRLDRMVTEMRRAQRVMASRLADLRTGSPPPTRTRR